MVKHGGITAREAMQELGIMRLSARIWELKREGVNIITERTKGANRYGETCYFDTYKVVAE